MILCIKSKCFLGFFDCARSLTNIWCCRSISCREFLTFVVEMIVDVAKNNVQGLPSLISWESSNEKEPYDPSSSGFCVDIREVGSSWTLYVPFRAWRSMEGFHDCILLMAHEDHEGSLINTSCSFWLIWCFEGLVRLVQGVTMFSRPLEDPEDRVFMSESMHVSLGWLFRHATTKCAQTPWQYSFTKVSRSPFQIIINLSMHFFFASIIFVNGLYIILKEVLDNMTSFKNLLGWMLRTPCICHANTCPWLNHSRGLG